MRYEPLDEIRTFPPSHRSSNGQATVMDNELLVRAIEFFYQTGNGFFSPSFWLGPTSFRPKTFLGAIWFITEGLVRITSAVLEFIAMVKYLAVIGDLLFLASGVEQVSNYPSGYTFSWDLSWGTTYLTQLFGQWPEITIAHRLVPAVHSGVDPWETGTSRGAAVFSV